MRMWGLVTLLAVGCGGTQTICATNDALDVDPELDTYIAEAVDYWEQRGHGGLIASTGGNCDVPVRAVHDGKAAQAMRRNNLVTGDCTPTYVEIGAVRWTDEVMSRDAQVRVLEHELGHLHCLDHEADGVMSTEWHY